LPNIKVLEKNLKVFSETLNADEVVLFERSTFLVISYYDAKKHEDQHRFEKISNIIKYANIRKLEYDENIANCQPHRQRNNKIKRNYIN